MKRSVAVLLALGFVAPLPLVRGQEGVDLNSTDEIAHVLNRITFGPRPGDIEMVQKIGLQAYIQQQLHPEMIDDSAVDQEVAEYHLLTLSGPELSTMYFQEVAARRAKAQAAVAAAAPNAGSVPVPNTSAPAPATPALATSARPVAFLGQMQAVFPTLDAVADLENAKLLRAVGSPRQLQEVLVDFWSNHFNIDMKKGPCRVLKVADDRDVIRPRIFGRFRDLLEASAKSPAMLFYLDNASNTAPHQPPARFAALFNLNPGDGVTAAPKTRNGGINENYAREIMELHTLGVDGGYTQADVQNVARCFTGWTIDRRDGSFRFAPFLHDDGVKMVLGHVIPANGGMRDGEMVLDILCAEPACAQFISRELCQRFVADAPPQALVDRIAGVFTSTGGDLRQVTAATLASPEFLSPADFGNKIKSPLEFAVSAVRASESSFAPDLSPFGQLRVKAESAAILGREKAADRLGAAKQQSLNWHVYTLGEPLFACTPPTGYKEDSQNWVNPGALIERLNFALALTNQQVSDVKFDPHTIMGTADLDRPQSVLDQCVSVLLNNKITDGTRKVLSEMALPTGESQVVRPEKLIALILGSPEFQRK